MGKCIYEIHSYTISILRERFCPAQFFYLVKLRIKAMEVPHFYD